MTGFGGIAALVQPDASLVTDRGYLYHATNEERARDIAESGALRPHGPSYGTDQREWPDGSREKRSYFSRSAGSVWAFAPEDGRAVVLRVIESGLGARTESTGDVYVTRPVPARLLEILTSDGWAPLRP